MLKKRILLVSQLFDLATIPLMKVQQDVQILLNDLTGGRVLFQLQQVSGSELEATFHRGFSYPQTVGQGMIHELDAVMIIGCGLNNFTMPVGWYTPCRGLSNLFDFYIPVNDFLQCYKQSARVLKASRTKNIQLNVQPTKVVMKLAY